MEPLVTLRPGTPDDAEAFAALAFSHGAPSDDRLLFAFKLGRAVAHRP